MDNSFIEKNFEKYENEMLKIYKNYKTKNLQKHKKENSNKQKIMKLPTPKTNKLTKLY